MEPAWIAAGFAGLALAMNLVVTIWRGGKHSASDLSQMESRLTQTIAEVARDMEGRHDNIAKMVGDSIAAIREQMRLNEKEIISDIHDLSDRVKGVEIWARDEFVRKESFREVAARIENTVIEQGRNMKMEVTTIRNAIMQYVARDHIDLRDSDKP